MRSTGRRAPVFHRRPHNVRIEYGTAGSQSRLSAVRPALDPIMSSNRDNEPDQPQRDEDEHLGSEKPGEPSEPAMDTRRDDSGEDAEPIELEPLKEDPAVRSGGSEPSAATRSKIADLDVCPNCGAPLTGLDEVVCMRCGFDLRTLQRVETRAAADVEGSEDEGEDVPAAPIASSHRPRMILSGALIAIAWVLLLIGYVAGSASLVPGAELHTVGEGEETRQVVAAGARVAGLLKAIVLSGTWVACALAALAVFARLVARPFGDLRAALLHVIAIVSVMQLSRFFDIPLASYERLLELIAQIVIFPVFALVLLRLSRRDVVTYTLMTVLIVLCLYFGSHVLAWAMSS